MDDFVLPRTALNFCRTKMRWIAAVAAAAVLAVPVAADANDIDKLQKDLDRSRGQLDGAQDELDLTREQIEDLTQQVRDAEVKLDRLERELGQLEADLQAATAVADAAAADVAKAQKELEALEAELADAEAYLAQREELLTERAVAAFMRGPVNPMAVIVEAESVADFLNSTYFLKTVMDADKRVIDDVTDLTEQLDRAREEAVRRRAELVVKQNAADEARAEVEDLTEQHREVTRKAKDERDHRAKLLQELKVTEAATLEEIDDLERESRELEQKLKKAIEDAKDYGNGGWVWPVDGGYITSSYGYRTHPIYGTRRLHAGVDIGGGWGKPIRAAKAGTVIAAYCTASGYGCRTVISHGDGITTLYAHQSKFAVTGGTVTGGEVIGYIGSTGASTGPHLHFEVRVNGAPTDPMKRY